MTVLMTTINRWSLHHILDLWILSSIRRAMSVICASTVRIVPPTFTGKKHRVSDVVEGTGGESMEAFAAEVRSLFEAPLREGRLLDMSRGLQEEYREKLRESEVSMLPSYQHTLPTGKEQGDFLALDVGGSTFRLALVRLGGSVNMGQGTGLQVRRMKSLVIDKEIRGLRGQAFFDWMADRIGDMLAEYNLINGTTDARLDMGLAWSFPIEQTSPQSGRLQPMGKGFCASQGIEGQDLSEIVMRSCRRRSLNVNLKAIINDGQATLLSQAYKDPATRMSLILGTGTNAAVFMPVTALGNGKFGQRPESWHATAQRVLINTEMSMFGKHVLPTTRWDEELNTSHVLPDFQPLEYLVTGRYMGEIVRLILLEAVRTVGLFDGDTPRGLDEPYSLDTRTLASLHGDTSPQLAKGRDAFLHAHPLPSRPRQRELEFLREVAILVSRRAAAYLAVALHALWTVRTKAEGLQTDQASHITIACDGTIVAKYPDFRTCCQRYLDELCALSGASRDAVKLELAPESSIFGAAVASCCLGDP